MKTYQSCILCFICILILSFFWGNIQYKEGVQWGKLQAHLFEKNIEYVEIYKDYEYELINENVRFNKKTGSLEYFEKFTPFMYGGKYIYGTWINKENIKSS